MPFGAYVKLLQDVSARKATGTTQLLQAMEGKKAKW